MMISSVRPFSGQTFNFSRTLGYFQASRQCGGNTGIVCCDNSASVGLACLTNITQMFDNIKTAMEFRVTLLIAFLLFAGSCSWDYSQTAMNVTLRTNWWNGELDLD